MSICSERENFIPVRRQELIDVLSADRDVPRAEELDVPIYQRLVMIMKLRPHNRLGKHVDAESVYLQLFKNTPRLDINMLLPGARAKMTYVDRGRISLTLITGLALTTWQIA